MNKLLSKLGLLSCLASVLMMSACSQSGLPSAQAPQSMDLPEVLNVGLSGEQAPFNFISNKNELVGYDVDLAKMLADKMDVKLNLFIMPFPELLEALNTQELNLILSGFSVTEERKLKVNFVGPYAMAGKSILVTKTALARIKNSTGFNDQSIKLLALANSTSESFAKNRLPKAQLTTVHNYDDALIALKSGKADALVADLSVCQLEVLKDKQGELTTLLKPLKLEAISMAVNFDEAALESNLRQGLQELKSTGALEELHAKWFENPQVLDLLPLQ